MSKQSRSKNNSDHQKREEKTLIERSFKIAQIQAEIEDQPSPPCPDAIIKYNGKKIGLEHTDLFIDDGIQKLQHFANSVTGWAAKNYKGPPSSIYPTFEKGKTKKTPKDLGESLAAFCAKTPDGIHYNPVFERARLTQIKSVRISRYPSDACFKDSAWRPELYCSNEDMVEALRKRILEKEEKRKSSYSKKIPCNWLLITARPAQASQFFHWTPKGFGSALASTGFERILFCDLSFGRCFDIPPS
ncbi:MAG: hypothetical protein WC464_08875 [Bdellovibrionales bacterium]